MSRDEFLGFLKGNALKYLWRYRHKGGSQDLEKADFYLKRLRETYEKSKITIPPAEVTRTALDILSEKLKDGGVTIREASPFTPTPNTFTPIPDTYAPPLPTMMQTTINPAPLIGGAAVSTPGMPHAF